MTLEVLEGREEFGFTFDLSHLHWQGVDPVEFCAASPIAFITFTSRTTR